MEPTDMNTVEGGQLLTSAQVAVWLQIQPATLSRWRGWGIGPVCTWLRPDVPRYLRADVAAWIENQRAA